MEKKVNMKILPYQEQKLSSEDSTSSNKYLTLTDGLLKSQYGKGQVKIPGRPVLKGHPHLQELKQVLKVKTGKKSSYVPSTRRGKVTILKCTQGILLFLTKA